MRACQADRGLTTGKSSKNSARMTGRAHALVALGPTHPGARQAIGNYWRRGTDQGLEVTTLALEVDASAGGTDPGSSPPASPRPPSSERWAHGAANGVSTSGTAAR